MKRVLIVDDEEAVRSLLEEFLVMNGYDCAVASNAAEGRELLQEVNFDLVLSDLNMPGESGFQFLQHVLSEKPNVEVILYTGYHDTEVEKKALDMGVSTYITKPFSLGTLLTSLNGALQDR